MSETEKSTRLLCLQEEENELFDKLAKIRNERNALIIGDNNFKGKFLHIRGFGYMYVYSQNFWNEKVWLQGFYFNSASTKYTDDFYLEVDACKDWEISQDWFLTMVQRKEFNEMTKEDFILKYLELNENFQPNVVTMLEKCITIHKEDEV